MSKTTSPKDIRAQLNDLEAKKRSLMRQLETQTGVRAPRVMLWAVCQDYLQMQGGRANFEEMVEDLVAQKHDLGKYPRRTVKQALVSPSCKSIFLVEESTARPKKGDTGKPVKVETVSLRTLASQVEPYRSGVVRVQQGKQTAAQLQ